MNNTSTPRLVRLSTAAATAAVLLALTGCDSSDNDVTHADASNAQKSSHDEKAAELPSFEDRSLYNAIIFARENDLSYAVKDREGDTPKTDNTREWTVVEQKPASGESFEQRDNLQLTVEKSE